ncbi:MAG: glycosyltransferase family 2 protein [Halobacteriovoraceae bacterium]|jgi:teichuronic acid biosynthesis glycosyltransferase TuaG|nr:glycosyltransferase family 2 protein [Halobacteriovoraceae bacterium]
MQSAPLVSIIIPNFNSQKYLRETILSVIGQTYKNWELIIVDDHSTDNSIKMIEEFTKSDPRVTMLKTIKNSGGPATPRNIGLEHASGDYIAFLDSDDTWFQDKLSVQIEYMLRENSKFSATMRNTFHYQDEQKNQVEPNLKLKVFSYKRLLNKNLVNTSSVILHRDLTQNLKFDTANKFIAIEDYDYWLKLLEQNEIQLLIFQFETLNYRITGENISGAKFAMSKKFLYVLKKHGEDYISLIYHFFTYGFLSIIYLIKKR